MREVRGVKGTETVDTTDSFLWHSVCTAGGDDDISTCIVKNASKAVKEPLRGGWAHHTRE